MARDISIRLQVVGQAEAFESVALKSRVDGQVAALLFSEGSTSRQGDLLIRLDSADFAARLAQAEAGAARDEALFGDARRRRATWHPRSAISFPKRRLTTRAPTKPQRRANLRASKAAVEVARLQRDYAEIRAPIPASSAPGGVPGSTVKTNDTTLAVINRFSPARQLSGSGKASAPARGHAPGQRSRSRPAARRCKPAFRGAWSASSTTRSTRRPAPSSSRPKLDNADELLTPGQFLNVSLILDTLSNAVTVPNAAVQQGAEGNFIYVVGGDGAVEMRKVETAASDAVATAIAKGWRSEKPSSPTASAPDAGRQGSRSQTPTTRKATRRSRKTEAGEGRLMNLPELCIRRPVMTTLLMAAFVIFGVIAYRALPVSELPNVDFLTIWSAPACPAPRRRRWLRPWRRRSKASSRRSPALIR